jgi:hypothetical protein
MDSKRRIKRFSIIFLVFILLTSLSSVSATGILASPGSFHLKMTAPQTYQGTLIVENIGSNTLNVTIDKKRLQMDNVHLLFSDVGIATWISINQTNFLLAPNEKKTVQFTVNVPSNLNYYDAMGALVVRGYPVNQTTSQSNKNLPTMQVQQVPEIVVPITVGLPGQIIESLQLKEHSAPSFLFNFMTGSFVYHVKNNGTVYANMTGNIAIKGWFTSHNVTFNGGVYPDDQYYMKTSWTPGIWDFGIYDAKTTIKYGRYSPTKTLTTDDTIFVFPVWLIILIVLGVTIWVVRKKDIKSPIKIKIEKK